MQRGRSRSLGSSSSDSDRSRSPPRRRRRSYSSSSSDSSLSSSPSPSRSPKRDRNLSPRFRKNRSPPRRSRSPPPKTEDINEIIVKGLTKAINKEHIEEIFGVYGALKKVELDIDEKTGYSKGSGIVEYDTHESTLKAIDHLDESQIDGKLVSLRLKLPPRAPRDRRRSPPRDSYRGGRGYSPTRRHVPYPPRRDDRHRDYERRRSPSPYNRRRRRSYSSSRSPSPRRRARSPRR